MVGAGVLSVGQVEAGGAAVAAPGTAAPTETKDILFTVSTDKVNGPISPYIYGLNFQDPAGMNATVRRLGGNRMTGYNWTNNFSNAGTDWNNFSDDYLCVSAKLHRLRPARRGLPPLRGGEPEGGAGFARHDPDGGLRGRGQEREVEAEETAPSPRWAKVEFEKKGAFTLTPTPDSKVVYDDEFVNFLVHNYKKASEGGIKFYDLDNEPALWFSKHPRLHPKKPTYEEILDKTDKLANAILKVDPSAMILGPVAYGWQEFLTLQEAPGYKELNEKYGTFLDYYLQSLQELEKKEGHRLVHVLDLHWYPEARGNNMRITENDITPASIEARVQAPRSLWDPTYVEESWITKYSTNDKSPSS